MTTEPSREEVIAKLGKVAPRVRYGCIACGSPTPIPPTRVPRRHRWPLIGSNGTTLLAVTVLLHVLGTPEFRKAGKHAALNSDAHRVMVPLQYRGHPTEQVSPKHLWVQVSDLPDDAPHDRVLADELRGLPAGAGAAAERAVREAVHEDRGPLVCFLSERRRREHLPALHPRLLQPGDRGDHADVHRLILRADPWQGGDEGDIPCASACGGGDRPG
mmetsp:Transcript_41161/g.131738  ORF Transcript_41161/g.131738 Transcript_41161/m.131738 type:complete len:216 (+) Transcript_41161:171-818(+)